MYILVWNGERYVRRECRDYIEAGNVSRDEETTVLLYQANGGYVCWFHRGQVQD